jgi:hypothetical protein
MYLYQIRSPRGSKNGAWDGLEHGWYDNKSGGTSSVFSGKGGIRMRFSDPQTSLLVRATNWLGDAVMTTPALAAVREGFPDARIVLLARPLVAELFRHHPDVDEVMVYERPGRHEGALGRLRLAGELRRRRFDGALLLQNAFDAALIAFLGRIPERAVSHRWTADPLTLPVR